MTTESPWSGPLPRRLPPCSPHWGTPEFREELLTWCTGVLGPLTAAAETKRRGWSTVWRVEARSGVHFVKQSCPLQGFEPALTVELARLAPDHVVPVTGADPAGRLLMTPDQGPPLAETGVDDLETWRRVLVAGAELQRRVLPSADVLVAAGLTPFAPTDCAPYVEARLEALAALAADHPQHLARDDADRLRARLPDVRRWADEVAALGLPLTLNHNDLHDANVFATDERMRFFDFGDALLTEPLAVLAVPLDVLRGQLGAAPGDPRVRRVGEAALEVWSDLVPLAELRAALPSALRLACLGRTESWLRVSASTTEAELAELGGAAGAWLLRILDDPPL